ncbi:pilus assembly protein [Coralloluteibacterium thermophilus]|uniref:Pilus assembly protein n=1 Tax=Coralloluteibacterium thermophilum TaxID=2707049 RepID=A0ABV9NLC0_9GAMM
MTANKFALGALVFLLSALGGLSAPVRAAQGQGQLAQYPLSLGTPVAPAFIMAVDDSNSMTFERLFPGGDGRMQWNSSNSSFFANNGSFFNVGAACSNNSTDCYLYLFPHDGYNSSYSPGRAIPPLDAFGFARSHVYNAGYFNPGITYEPWRNADGSLWPNATPSATRADPRNPAIYGNSFSRAYNVVYNLTANRANTGETFQMLNGMSIPDLAGRGMRHRQGNSWSTAARSITSNTTVAFDYFPATFYLPANDPAPPGYRTQDQYRPIVNNACGPGCNMRRYEIKLANYTTQQAYNAAIQNFANWFQYHRSRLLAMVGSMTHAVYSVNNMRIGYFTINNRVNVTMHEMPTERAPLYQSFFGLQAGGLVNAGGGTPNRDAVAHLGEQFRRTDAGAPIVYACQKNGGMLFTDGFTNSNTGPTNVGNVDGNMGAPFADNFSNTIADIAARYYLDTASGGLAPLRTGAGFPAGQVPVPDACRGANPDPRLDCQSNLHMNFYGVTLGARGAIFDVNEAATADPFANPPNWNAAGNPRSSDGAPTVDEIWHGTINARGDFVNAKTPVDVTEAMQRVLASVGGGESPSGSLGLTGARVGESSFTVTPSFTSGNNGTDWYSRLIAERPVATAGEISYTRLWDAAQRLPAPDVRARNTVVGRGHGNNDARPQLAPFAPAAFGANDTERRALLCSNGRARCTGSDLAQLGSVQDFLRYLMGDASREVRNGGTFRDRTTPLGDIVNSTPVIASPRDNYGYAGLAGTEQDPLRYRDYLARKADRAPLVLVGANDGMFHAFNGDSGTEAFAYIPTTAVGHLGNLAFPYRPEDRDNQKFQHRYYVDGPVTVSDAYFGANDWRTVAVGTAGAGGRGVFALDISNPSSFSANAVLWEISDQMRGREVWRDIGHVVSKPVVVPVLRGNTPTWVAVFGNGYGSDNNDPVLFVVDMRTGQTRTIAATRSHGADRDRVQNGLGNIIVLDRWRSSPDNGSQIQGTDGYADTVYGADQRGNIWKFDLRDDSLAYDQPLFTATDDQGNPQPITGGLEAATGPGGGVMLYFGTGSFAFENDAADTSLQRFYGVWDNGEPVTRPLQRQTLSPSAADPDVRNVTASAVNYMSHAGWYLDLALVQNERATLAGERFVGYPRLQNGIVFFTTFEPGSSDACAGGGRNWLYALNALSGLPSLGNLRIGSPTASPLGEPAGGVALETGGDAPVTEIAVVLPPPPQALGAGATAEQIEAELNRTCDLVVQTAGSQPMYLARGCGRQSWRQIR